ncbi:MAG TPA: hypothetical protein VD902_20525 [Symbiobacteriaceae bacterium]|nr:hypothetical protein [Symbiobacteriaceae bacterium]
MHHATGWRRPEVTWTAGAVFLLMASVYVGSGGFRELDKSLIGYLVGTILFIGGCAYRLAQFMGRPQAAMYFRGALRYLFDKDVRRAVKRRQSAKTAAKGLVMNVAAQDFIWRRGWFRWLLHFNIAWGCLLSFAITFPLVFGWLRFSLVGMNHYQVVVMGVPTFIFPVESLFGWLLFHALDFTAVMVVLGVVLAYYKRFKTERFNVDGRSMWDLLPLHLLMLVALTGLLLTVSSIFLHGAGYTVITLTHQVLVVILLTFIPFSKLFHFLFRPLAVAVMVYHEAGAEQKHCRNCNEAYAPANQIEDLRGVLGTKGFSQPLMEAHLKPVPDAEMLDLCPNCKRLYRAWRYIKPISSQPRGYQH